MTAPKFLYRFGLTNWLMAKPWRWKYKAIWDSIGKYPTVRKHFFWRLWQTISFPHVHHPDDEHRVL